MKPLNPVTGMYEAGELFHLSISTDGQHLYLRAFADGAGVNQLNSMTIDRPTAEWLIKQLKKALKKPKDKDLL